MGKNRLEAFSDGVIAIIITIMVLEIKPPAGVDWDAVRGALPVFLAYVLSFVNVGIFWNNHHHMLHATSRVDGRVLWANMFLLFWLSLLPFTVRWMGEGHFAALPVATYGLVLAGSAIGYFVLERAIILCDGPQSKLATAVKSDWKEKLSLALYIAAIPLAFVSVWIAIAIYVAVAVLWLVPDRRIERVAA